MIYLFSSCKHFEIYQIALITCFLRFSYASSVTCIPFSQMYNRMFYQYNNVTYAGWIRRTRGWDVQYFYSVINDKITSPFYAGLDGKVDEIKTSNSESLPNGRIFLTNFNQIFVFYYHKAKLVCKQFVFGKIGATKYGLYEKYSNTFNHQDNDALPYIVSRKESFINTRSCKTLIGDFNWSNCHGECSSRQCLGDSKLENVYNLHDSNPEFAYRAQNALFCNIFRVDKVDSREVTFLTSKEETEKITVNKRLLIITTLDKKEEVTNCIDIPSELHPGQFYSTVFKKINTCQPFPPFKAIVKIKFNPINVYDAALSPEEKHCDVGVMNDTYVVSSLLGLCAFLTFFLLLMFALGHVGKNRRIRKERLKQMSDFTQTEITTNSGYGGTQTLIV